MRGRQMQGWSESDSEQFLSLGEVITPSRDEQMDMLAAAKERLEAFAQRVELRSFRLEEQDAWTFDLPAQVRCFVSSLVVHHLADSEKRMLYQKLHQHLVPGGALLLIDVVLPVSTQAQAAIGANWDAVVREQSLAATGSLATYLRFREEGWNCYTCSDPMDQPAPLLRQLSWIEAVGFRDVDCFWLRGGHAAFGGYK